MCGSSTPYRVGDHPEAPWASRFFFWVIATCEKFTHLEIRSIKVRTDDFTSLRGDPSFGVFFCKGFIPGVWRVSELHSTTGCEQGSNDGIQFSRFLDTHCNVYTPRRQTWKQNVSDWKSKSPLFKCFIFAGRHMPAADLLIGHVFFSSWVVLHPRWLS